MVFSWYVHLFKSRPFPGTALSQPSPDITFTLAWKQAILAASLLLSLQRFRVEARLGEGGAENLFAGRRVARSTCFCSFSSIFSLHLRITCYWKVWNYDRGVLQPVTILTRLMHGTTPLVWALYVSRAGSEAYNTNGTTDAGQSLLRPWLGQM